MEQRKPFRFDERFPHLREYSTINSTDAKAPIILGSKNSFNTGRTWISYINEDDRWRPLEEKNDDSIDIKGRKRQSEDDEKLVKLQALPCHDYHSTRDVIVPNTNLFIEKSFHVDEKNGRESVCWTGTKLSVIVSPKFEYSNGALTHVNERYQLRRYGDKEVKMKMTLPHTDVPSVSLQYLLDALHSWLVKIKERGRLVKYLSDIDTTDASNLSTCLRRLSKNLIKVPTPPVSLIPIYQKKPSEVLEKLVSTLGEDRLAQMLVPVSPQSSETSMETYSTMMAMKNFLLNNDLEECTFEVESVGRVKVVNVLQRVIDHVVIRTCGLPIKELNATSSTVNGMSWIKEASALLDDLSTNREESGEIGYLREMSGVSLMLEIAESLEAGEDVWLNENVPSSDIIDIAASYRPLVQGRQISLDCEPRPFNYRLVDGGPDQKQSHLPTKIAAAIEFRMELNSHACIQRRAERDSVANEAERGNSILGHAATVGSTISNCTFKTFDACLAKLESELEERSVDHEGIEKVKNIASSLGDDFIAEMNMWYGAKELAKRWNGFPCFGQTIFAETPLAFYQLPISHHLEADIQAYGKATKAEKEESERFDWIRQNIQWYDIHGEVSPSGYYKERRACTNPSCCGTRMLPLSTPQTPKPSLTKLNHYEERRVVDEMLKEYDLTKENFAGLSLFPEISVDEKCYREMDFFLPSKALETVFNHRHGLTEKDMNDFRKVFPCPEDSLKEEHRKPLEKEKKKERKTLPISLEEQISADTLHNERLTRLTETLREICN